MVQAWQGFHMILAILAMSCLVFATMPATPRTTFVQVALFFAVSSVFVAIYGTRGDWPK